LALLGHGHAALPGRQFVGAQMARGRRRFKPAARRSN
jgi:hypothetical protein